MSIAKSRLYYSYSYQGLNDKPCYFIYIEDAGMFVASSDEVIKVLETPTFDLTENNIDSYAGSRGFVKVLERSEDGSINYYNGFDHAEKREDISRMLDKFKQFVFDNVRFSTLIKGKLLAALQGTASSVQSNAWYKPYE